MTDKSTHTKHDDDMLDPDVRFLLANERTLLAWIRTALAVVGGGVLLTQIGTDSDMRSVIGVSTILLGGFMATVGYLRFRRADKAIRVGELPDAGRTPVLQAAGVTVIAFVLVTSHIVGIW